MVTMDAGETFSLFSRLPSEVRHGIWRCALLMAEWSLSKAEIRKGRRLMLRGRRRDQSVSQACHEARHVSRLVYTRVPGVGWLNTARHLFFFRDAKAHAKLMTRVADRHDLLRHIEHMVVNPGDWPHLWETLGVVKAHCTALRTLVVVAPWFVPDATTEYDPDVDWAAPWEDWTEVFCKSSADVNSQPLLDAIEYGADTNTRRLAQYRDRLDQAVERLPDPLPNHMRHIDSIFWRTREALQRLQLLVRDFGDGGVALYLRTVAELRPPTATP